MSDRLSSLPPPITVYPVEHDDADDWLPGPVRLMQHDGGVHVREGLRRGPLALTPLPLFPFGDDEQEWALTHNPSGYRIGNISGAFPHVVPVANRIHALGNWAFPGIAVPPELRRAMKWLLHDEQASRKEDGQTLLKGAHHG